MKFDRFAEQPRCSFVRVPLDELDRCGAAALCSEDDRRGIATEARGSEMVMGCRHRTLSPRGPTRHERFGGGVVQLRTSRRRTGRQRCFGHEVMRKPEPSGLVAHDDAGLGCDAQVRFGEVHVDPGDGCDQGQTGQRPEQGDDLEEQLLLAPELPGAQRHDRTHGVRRRKL